jgi:phosphoribosylanthranilate isomerase
MFRLKICGITNLEDAIIAQNAGADALGFIFCLSPRQVALNKVRQIRKYISQQTLTVGVFRDQERDEIRRTVELCNLDYVQLHGEETIDFADALGLQYLKVINVNGPPKENELFWSESNAAGIVLDNGGGGSGEVFDWSLFVDYRRLNKPLILAGGLTPENVYEAVVHLEPDAVDVCSGVELMKGKKDPDKIRRFIRAVKIGL